MTKRWLKLWILGGYWGHTKSKSLGMEPDNLHIEQMFQVVYNAHESFATIGLVNRKINTKAMAYL